MHRIPLELRHDKNTSRINNKEYDTYSIDKSFMDGRAVKIKYQKPIRKGSVVEYYDFGAYVLWYYINS